jgi:hypothetical protein
MKTISKNLSFMFVLLFIVILNVSAQTYSWNTIQTPKGTDLQAGTLTAGEMDAYSRNFWKDFYLWYYENRIVWEDVATRSYNCHGYAWWVTEGGSYLWIGREDYDEDIDEDEDVFWEDNSYIEVPYQSWATKVSYGGPCEYYSLEWNRTANWCDHSAVTTGNNNWFKSKWGEMPLFSHDRTDCPYDDGDLHYYARNDAHISGPSTVCPSGTEFSVEDLLPGATISWSTSSNITRISSQGSNPCQFEANENGEIGWIDATFTFNGNQYTLNQKNVWVGSDLQYPVWLEIKGENNEFVEHTNDMWELCPNTNYLLRASSSSDISQWDWSIPESWELLSDENYPEILIQTGDYIIWEDEVHVDVYNYDCGNWLYYADYLLVTEPPYGLGCGELLQFNVYPNPATTSITLQINENESTRDNKSSYNISIVDKSGRVSINKATKGNMLNLDISNLPNGEYTIVISNGRSINSRPFIKNN